MQIIIDLNEAGNKYRMRDVDIFFRKMTKPNTKGETFPVAKY